MAVALGSNTAQTRHPLHGLGLGTRGTAAFLVLAFVFVNVGIFIARRPPGQLPRSPAARERSLESASGVSELRRMLDHDFGLVRPNQVCTKRFQIRNDSAIRWTLRSIEAGCACTVTHLSKNEIAPGGVADLDLRYSAGSVPVDDKRAVGVRFNERLAPYIRIEIAAHVRGLATAEPSEAILPVVEPTKSSIGYFNVLNFSGKLWKTVKVTASDPWVVLVATKRDLVPEINGSPAPSQVWTVTASARSTGLKAGLASAIAHVEGISTSDECVASVDVPILLRISSALTAVPASIHLNNLPDEGQRVRVFVHREELKPANNAEICLSHRFGESLIAKVVETQERVIVVHVDMVDGSNIHASAGTLTISISHGNASASLDIPLIIKQPSVMGS